MNSKQLSLSENIEILKKHLKCLELGPSLNFGNDLTASIRKAIEVCEEMNKPAQPSSIWHNDEFAEYLHGQEKMSQEECHRLNTCVFKHSEEHPLRDVQKHANEIFNSTGLCREQKELVAKKFFSSADDFLSGS